MAADTLVRGRVRRLQSVLDSCLECSHTPSLLLFLPGTALAVNAALLLPTVLPAHSCRWRSSSRPSCFYLQLWHVPA